MVNTQEDPSGDPSTPGGDFSGDSICVDFLGDNVSLLWCLKYVLLQLCDIQYVCIIEKLYEDLEETLTSITS